MDNLIKFEKGKITCILTKAHNTFLFAKQFIENNKNKNILLYQIRNLTYPCNNITLTYGTNLIRLVNDDLNKFDILLIDHLIDDFNSKETIEFLNYIKTDHKFKNKAFVVLFTKYTEDKVMNLEHYENCKKTILNVSDYLYVLNNKAYNLVTEELLK